MINYELLQNLDPELHEAISNELNRQRNKIELIASENFVSTFPLKKQKNSRQTFSDAGEGRNWPNTDKSPKRND